MKPKLWTGHSWDEYLYWQENDKKTLRKINSLIKDIERNGYNCKGKLEPLTGEFAGYWSVRIDKKNRLIFKVYDEFIEIAQCRNHYGDK